MKKSGLSALIILSLFSTISKPYGQGQLDLKFVTVSGKISQEKISPGNNVDIIVTAKIEPGYHINSNRPTEEYLIPTILKFESLENASFDKIIYPEPRMATFSFSEKEIAIYEGDVVFYTKFILSDKFSLKKSVIKGSLSFQACDDRNCFAPTEEPIEIPFEVVVSVSPGELTQRVGEPVPEQKLEITQEVVVSTPFTSDELKAKQIIERGLPYAIIAFFIFGLALNLTPCVYPVIPLTVGYFGGQSEQRKGSNLVMALFYVVGIAVIFALLGLISGLAGKQWGFLFQNPWFVIVITVIILSMSASMFGAFEITIPTWLSSSLGKSREGNFGALMMGLTVGVVIAPCAAGIIIGLVGLVAKLGMIAKGALLFFIMGLGLGLPYLVLATFSGLLNKLPQSGMWMVWVRKLFGVLLIGVALYFFLPQANHIYDEQGFFFGLLAIFGGLLLGFLDHSPQYSRTFKIGRGIFGVLLIILGVILAHQAIHAKPSDLNWIQYQNETIAELQQDGKHMFIDFYADWCAPCKEMDRTTFQDVRVGEMSKQFNMVKVDCTAPDEHIRKLMNQFQVTGMPTLVFLDQNGKEATELREIGYVGADKFVEKMQQVLR